VTGAVRLLAPSYYPAAATFQTDQPLRHNVPWRLGTREDGYLIGLDNLNTLIRLVEWSVLCLEKNLSFFFIFVFVFVFALTFIQLI
jgi:hypothetical protein